MHIAAETRRGGRHMARTNPNAQRFGAWLRPLLAAHGWSQTDLRRRMEAEGEDVGRQTVSQWVTGTNVPGTDYIILMAQLLHADPAQALRAAGLKRTADWAEGRQAGTDEPAEPADPKIEAIMADPNLPGDVKERVVAFYLRKKRQADETAIHDTDEFADGLRT